MGWVLPLLTPMAPKRIQKKVEIHVHRAILSISSLQLWGSKLNAMNKMSEKTKLSVMKAVSHEKSNRIESNKVERRERSEEYEKKEIHKKKEKGELKHENTKNSSIIHRKTRKKKRKDENRATPTKKKPNHKITAHPSDPTSKLYAKATTHLSSSHSSSQAGASSP